MSDPLEKRIAKLPPEKKMEVIDFIEFLESKEKSKEKKYMNLDWFGGLKEFKDRYSSLELQKKALEWWND